MVISKSIPLILYLLAILLIGHGLAHLSGVFVPWIKGMLGYANAAWFLT